MTYFVCPSVTKTVGKRIFELCLDFNAISIAERLTGKNLLDNKTWGDMDVTTLTVVFWAAAHRFNDKLTLQDIRSAGFRHAAAMTDAVREAFRLANEVPEDEARPMSGSSQTASPAL